ncbi:hypothetical protein NX059_000106 [Plenodomus lindquistii]|nr:hypothetical protein NX059_000106 [Plenodomus lindquistii]
MAPTLLSIATSNDYTISTWLLLGSTLQSLLVLILPRTIALLPPLLFLTYRLTHSYLIATNHIPNPQTKGIIRGRHTWKIPSSSPTTTNTDATKHEASDSIVVLVLAASWSHPNGRFSPGSKDLGDYFMRMWADASAHRSTYGFLGNTPGLSSSGYDTRPDGQGRTTVFLSYWKTLDGLRKFAHAATHMQGHTWWEKGAGDKYPHLGIMHETYVVPGGGWENVFLNFRRFGIGMLVVRMMS